MSLRTRIFLLVLLATCAPAALLGLYLFEDRDSEIAKAKQSLIALAAYAAEDLDNKVDGTAQLLHGLSRASDLDSRDRAACSDFLGEVLRRYPQYTGLLTIRPDGQLDCDSLRSGRRLDLNDRGYFKRARETMQPAFEAVFGRLTGVAVLQVAYPATDSQGKLRSVLLASLNLAQFSARFATASPHPELEMVIWDKQGTMLVRHPDLGPRKLAGTSQQQSALYRFVRGGRPGETTELPGPDGTGKIWALGVLPGEAASGLRITLGIPRAMLLADADRATRQALIILAGASLLAFLGALLFAEMGIRRHLIRISKAATLQGAGDFSARIGAPYPRGELGGLMATLDATAVSVEAQRAEIAGKSAELRRANRTLRLLSAINSTIVRVRDRDELLAEACRIAFADGQYPVVWAGLVEKGAGEVTPVAWQGVDRAYVYAVPRSINDHERMIGRAFRDRAAVVVNDLENETILRNARAALQRGSRAMAAFPLMVSGRPSGVLLLHAREAGFFDAQEMQLLNELAGDVAFALEYIENSEKLDYLAYFDPLTGLANRTLFHERLDQALGKADRESQPLALVMCDIERFRGVNDSLGRAAGDELLKQVAERIGAHLGDPRRLTRIDVDHFAFTIPGQFDATALARRLDAAHRQIFGEPFRVGTTDLRTAARFGIALFPGDAGDADTLFRNAEAALKKAKAGAERYIFYEPQMTERVAENLSLENKLRIALENDEFVLHYQPKVDLANGHIAGVEALIRWQSPELGLVPPLRFIPLLEETGLILQVGAWALRRAARDHREWVAEGLVAPRVAVNVSPIQLRQRDFVGDLRQAIAAGADGTGIDLEITESLAMEDIEGNIRKLQEVRALGLSIAIDDFGTGYSSLAYLAKLPVQTLKIDRSFVITMLKDPAAMTMVSTIISLAHALGLTVVAEGVDAREQANTLRRLGCDYMQGYLFSRPVPNAELVKLLRREEATVADLAIA
jgi:diguanylate cyclase (GGDEF)-like protein